MAHDRSTFPNWLPLVADVFSWSYAAVVIAAALWWNLVLPTAGAIALMIVFVLLRGLAREIHREQRRQARRLVERRPARV